MSLDQIANRDDRPAYVRFERRPVEDKAASQREGRYVAVDVDFALITPTYSKDCVEYKVTRWLENMRQNVRNGRVPEEWAEQYERAYKAWKEGQEIPISGTPILGWGMISPAQQKMLIEINCRTVEDLAAMNDEGIRRFGMGALDLKKKAVNWLESLNAAGPLAMRATALERENEILKSQVDTLSAKVEALVAALPATSRPEEVIPEITAADIIGEPPRRGRPPKEK